MKLNIGCGKKYEPEYLNIDLYEDLIADKKMSALDLLFEDNSCEEIKTIHTIEHLGFFKGIYALSEFFRVLEPKGTLILETPNIEKLFQTYLNSNPEQQKEVLSWIYGIPHKGLQHKFCYPPYLLEEQLKNIGFTNVVKTSFYNEESIPTLKIMCQKPEIDETIKLYQYMAHLRKSLVSKEIINFENSFLTKEQDDLVNSILSELIEFKTKKKKKNFFENLKKFLIKSPQIMNLILNILKDKDLISNHEIEFFLQISKLLIQFNFQNILYNSIKKAPIVPGSQKIIYISIEAFGIEVIDKLFLSKNENEKIIENLVRLSNSIREEQIDFFSWNTLERKSLDFFNQGIKEFYKENFKNSLNKFLTAIKIYRDNFLYFWNLARVFIKMDMKKQAIRYFKKTIRLLRMTKIENKKKIKTEINKEISWVKNMKYSDLNIGPIISVDKQK